MCPSASPYHHLNIIALYMKAEKHLLLNLNLFVYIYNSREKMRWRALVSACWPSAFCGTMAGVSNRPAITVIIKIARYSVQFGLPWGRLGVRRCVRILLGGMAVENYRRRCSALCTMTWPCFARREIIGRHRRGYNAWHISRGKSLQCNNEREAAAALARRRFARKYPEI